MSVTETTPGTLKLLVDVHDADGNVKTLSAQMVKIRVLIDGKDTVVSLARLLDKRTLFMDDIRNPDFENILRGLGVDVRLDVNINRYTMQGVPRDSLWLPSSALEQK